MTLGIRTISQSLQAVGLLGAVVGWVATLLLGGAFFFPWFFVGGIAIATDRWAIRTPSRAAAIAASLLKLALVLAGLSSITADRLVYLTSPASQPWGIASDFGPLLVLWSSIPSVLGAVSRRFAA